MYMYLYSSNENSKKSLGFTKCKLREDVQIMLNNCTVSVCVKKYVFIKEEWKVDTVFKCVIYYGYVDYHYVKNIC